MKSDQNASQPGSSAPLTSSKPLFWIEGVGITSKCAHTLLEHDISFPGLLARHSIGDWGDVPPEDKAANDQAVAAGHGRLFSAYQLTGTVAVWVITEGDWSYTTVLLPEDY